MPAQPISPAVIVGSVAASATTGALIAMGHRIGHTAIPFATISAAVFQPSSNAGAVGLVFTGFVLHVAAMFMWSTVYVWLAVRSGRRIVAAVAISAANFLASWIVAWSSGGGLATLLSLGDRLAFALVLAAALAIGMRNAFPSLRNAAT